MAHSTATLLYSIALIMLVTPVWAQLPPPAPAGEQRQPPPPVPADVGPRRDSRDRYEGAEPLVHGPVHEAFAAPTPRVPEPPSGIAKLPPEALEESPPPVAPQQDDITARWIPGYWGWDAREQEYVWVSGTWRSAPPEMEWVPGYWDTAQGDCHWVGGFWAPRGETELVYVAPPPAPREEELPHSPSENHFWVPGNWQFVEEEYRWKPGFWAERRDDWVWTPDCYAWTPRGHVFVRGYWDLPLERRGILFAPLAVRTDVVRRVSPTVAINLREALVHWFVAPTYGHYLFGNYYDVVPQGAGPLVSWYEYGTAGSKYDPILAYYSGYDARFLGSLKAKHKSYKLNAKSRPALVWRDYAGTGSGGMAFPIAAGSLPAGIASFDIADEEFAAVSGYYRSVSSRRAQFERGAAIVQSGDPLFVPLNTFLPPGHGGLPPGLAKKGLVPPGFGGVPPGQAKKVIESFGPIVKKPGKPKPGGKGKGKGR